MLGGTGAEGFCEAWVTFGNMSGGARAEVPAAGGKSGLKSADIVSAIKLRLAVGLLGENGQAEWWNSSWLSNQADAFLMPVFGARLLPVRYHGVVEAAGRLHDGRIGVGRVFHLFRLPEALEHRLHETVLEEGADQRFAEILVSADAARATLAAMTRRVPSASLGPVRVGDLSDLEGREWIARLAGHYQAAFAASIQSFPYFAEYP